MRHPAHPRGQLEGDVNGPVKDDEDRATSSALYRPLPRRRSGLGALRPSVPAKLRSDVAQHRIEDVGAVVHTELIGDSQQQSVGGGDGLVVS